MDTTEHTAEWASEMKIRGKVRQSFQEASGEVPHRPGDEHHEFSHVAEDLSEPHITLSIETSPLTGSSV